MLGFTLCDTYHIGIGIGILGLFRHTQDIVSPSSFVFIYYYSLIDTGSISNCIICFSHCVYYISCYSHPHIHIYPNRTYDIVYVHCMCICPSFFLFPLFLPVGFVYFHWSDRIYHTHTHIYTQWRYCIFFLKKKNTNAL